MTDPMVHALPVVDELSGAEGDALVLVGDASSRVVRLSIVGVAIRELAAAGMPLSRLAQELALRFGAPPSGDAIEQTRLLVRELADAGIVTLDEP